MIPTAVIRYFCGSYISVEVCTILTAVQYKTSTYLSALI